MIIALKKTREEKEISVDQLAEMTGLTKNVIWNYEAGRSKPDPETLCILADALDCSLDMLVRGKEKNRPEGRSIDDMVKIFKNLSPQELDMLLSLGAFLQYRKESPEQSGQGSKGNV